MRSHTGMFSTKKEQWNPEEVLGLINPDRGYLTCTAEAKTCGRRCRRAQNCMRDAARMLQDMAIMDPLSAAKSDNLYMIARLSVCYQHGGQADEICREWRDKLRQLGSSRKASPRSQSPFVNFKCEPDSEDEFFEDEFLKRNTQRPSQRDYTHADLDSMLEKLRRIQEAINNMQSQKQEEEKRKQAAAEQLRREKAEEAQRQRKEAEEQKKKEQERQARANKQREEFIKERAGKSAAAREQPAKKQWADSWQEYLDGWDHLKGKSCREAAPIMIPWPVKSGKWEDVSEENVKLFFQKAPPVAVFSSDAKEAKFRLMSKESMRWHQDKISQLFGLEVFSGKHASSLKMIARIVVELRQSAQKARKD